MYYISWEHNKDETLFGHGDPIFPTLESTKVYIEAQLKLDEEKYREGQYEYNIKYRAVWTEARVLNADD